MAFRSVLAKLGNNCVRSDRRSVANMLGAFETRTLNNYPNIRDDDYEDLMQERIERRREVCMCVQLELAYGFSQDVDLAESSLVFNLIYTNSHAHEESDACYLLILLILIFTLSILLLV